MSTTAIQNQEATPDARVGQIDMKLEVVPIPVSDLDRAKAFHGGLGPDRGTYGSYASFRDPDGNGWLLQEVTRRFPGRVAGDTTYTSAYDLSQALRRAEAAHVQYEKRTGRRDANWADRYAAYLVAEQAGTELPS